MSFFGSSFAQTLEPHLAAAAPTVQLKSASQIPHAPGLDVDLVHKLQPLFLLLRNDMHAEFGKLHSTIEASCRELSNQLSQKIVGEGSVRQDQVTEIIQSTTLITSAMEQFNQQFRDVSAQLKGIEGQIQVLMAEVEAVEGHLDESFREKVGILRSELRAFPLSINKSSSREVDDLSVTTGNPNTQQKLRPAEKGGQNVISYHNFAQHLENNYAGTQIAMTQQFLPTPEPSTKSNFDLI